MHISKLYGQNTTILSPSVVYRLYSTTTCFGPGYWPSPGCSQLIDQLYNVRRFYSGGTRPHVTIKPTHIV